MILSREEVIAALKHISHNELTGFNIAQAIEAAILAKLEQAEPVCYGVVEQLGEIKAWDYVCGWPEAAHEHINDALSNLVDAGLKDLPKFSVVPLYAHPLPTKPGWKLVPKQPTEKMLAAYHYSWGPNANYKAMLAAAPETE